MEHLHIARFEGKGQAGIVPELDLNCGIWGHKRSSVTEITSPNAPFSGVNAALACL
jgi:hypothetical protein